MTAMIDTAAGNPTRKTRRMPNVAAPFRNVHHFLMLRLARTKTEASATRMPAI
jgi:hypothetical protein